MFAGEPLRQRPGHSGSSPLFGDQLTGDAKSPNMPACLPGYGILRALDQWRCLKSQNSNVNAGVLKVKLATALIGISSIHLLKTFIELGTKELPNNVVMRQLLLHLTFVFSALMLAVTDRISTQAATGARSFVDRHSNTDGKDAAGTSRLADQSLPL